VKAMRGATTPAERFSELMGRLSTRQRIVVLTFDCEADAVAWDTFPDIRALAALSMPDEVDEVQA